MSFEVTPLDLNQIKEHAAKDQVWVINNTDLGRSQSRGDFYLEIVDRQNIAHPIKLPATWLAVNLALFAQASDIVLSQNFVTAVRKQLLVVISPAEAEKVNARPGADVERAKVRELNQALGSFALPNTKVSINTGGSLAVQAAPTEAPRGESSTSSTDKELRGLVQRFNDNQISEEDAIAALDAFNPPPSSDGFKDATDMVHMKGSIFYRQLAERIGDAAPAPLGAPPA